MLDLIVTLEELFNSETSRFLTKTCTLRMEHSLISLSKWESKWCKPFLAKEEKTREETLDYLRCMTIAPPSDPGVYNHISRQNIWDVQQYIDAPMTATIFSGLENNRKAINNREFVTAEIIYYWMVTFQIPFECEKWHLNRLITLVNVCNIKNNKSKDKVPMKDVHASNHARNLARRKRWNSTG